MASYISIGSVELNRAENTRRPEQGQITITKANLSKTVVPASRQNQRVSEGLSRLK